MASSDDDFFNNFNSPPTKIAGAGAAAMLQTEKISRNATILLEIADNPYLSRKMSSAAFAAITSRHSVKTFDDDLFFNGMLIRDDNR